MNKVWKSLKSYYMEDSVVQQVVTELLKLIGVTSFNDLLMRRNFSSWKRGKCDLLTMRVMLTLLLKGHFNLSTLIFLLSPHQPILRSSTTCAGC